MEQPSQPKLSSWQCVILILSIYVLTELLCETIFSFPPEVARLLAIADFVVCLFFLADFVVQLTAAKSKAAYLKWGWIDLVSSIPSLPFLRLGRITRVVRIIRLLRGVRSVRVIVTHVFENRARGVFTSVALISFVLILFSSITILNVETEPNATIKTAEDALWWSLATITTVGYGDVYPKSTAGHFVAAILMVAGIALFSTFTATVASVFVQKDIQREDDKADLILRKLDALATRLDHEESNRKRPTPDARAAEPVDTLP